MTEIVTQLNWCVELPGKAGIICLPEAIVTRIKKFDHICISISNQENCLTKPGPLLVVQLSVHI